MTLTESSENTTSEKAQSVFEYHRDFMERKEKYLEERKKMRSEKTRKTNIKEIKPKKTPIPKKSQHVKLETPKIKKKGIAKWY